MEGKMMEREYLVHLRQLWEKNWPKHLPKELEYPFGEVPLPEYLREWAKQKPDQPALIFYGKELTYKELDESSDRFAAFLQSRGLKKGDRVATFLSNCPQFLIIFYGVLKLGCIHVPVNPMFKEEELLYELNDSGAEIIVALDQLLPIVLSVKERTSVREIITTRFSDFLPGNPTLPVHPTMMVPPVDTAGTFDFTTLLAEHKPEYREVEVGLADVAALNYTGGTTGMPKGCEHTHRNMLYTAACMRSVTRESIPGTGLMFIPMFWIGGQNTGLIGPIFSGNTLVLLTRWDVKAVLMAIERYKVLDFGGTVDNVVEVMEYPDVKNYDLSSLRVAYGMSFVRKMNINYRKQWNALVGDKCILRESAYGLTETHTMDTNTNGYHEQDMDLLSEPVFCGLPMPGTEIKITDFETGEIVPLGEKGQIAIRTPSLFKSYWNKPEETKQAVRDGWLSTGDIGMLDEEGYLHYLGRKKEMLKVKGMSVFPSELEVLLGKNPVIEGSAVIGKSDPDKGEVPVAFIKLQHDAVGKVSEQDLRNWCMQNMAVYKVPEIRIVEDFPLTATGKVRKEELRVLL